MRVLGYGRQNTEVRSQKSEHRTPIEKVRDLGFGIWALQRLFTICFILFAASCTTKRVELPSYEGIDIKDIIAERSSIEGVEATFSVEFEKNDSTITGEAAVELTENFLDLRIYSLGFLVAEITERDGVIKSNPEISKSRSIILVDGLRNGILWWFIRDYEIYDQNEFCQLRNSWQKITVDKKTMLPVSQAIELENGKELRIFYEEPLISGEFWYPSKMRIELSRYIVKLEIKTISFLPHPDQDQQQRHL